MKKIIILLSIFFLGTIIYANPKPPVDLLITELYFDENDKWYLELSFISMGDVDEEYNSFYTFPNFYLHSLTDTIYLFQKEFNTIKILRGDLEKMPLPILNSEQHLFIEEKVNQILQGDNNIDELLDTVDNFIMDIFNLTITEKLFINKLNKN